MSINRIVEIWLRWLQDNLGVHRRHRDEKGQSSDLNLNTLSPNLHSQPPYSTLSQNLGSLDRCASEKLFHKHFPFQACQPM